jgi:hypothetical protein
MSPSSFARSDLAKTPEAALVVTDASVLVELVIDERHRAGAEVLLARYADPQTRLTFGTRIACYAVRHEDRYPS